VDDARSVSVATDTGPDVAGTVVGDDGDTGVAVVRAPGRSGPPPAQAVPDKVPTATKGQLVFAIALDPGASGGLVMGVGTVRTADTQMTSEGRPTYLDVMELDAPLPAGTPGGLVLDGSGTPIGLTLAVLGDGGRQRTYAAPFSVVRDSAGQLAATGHVVHAWLGVEGHDLDTKAAAGMGLAGGAEVTSVQPGSPAAGAGLQGNDVIGEVDGRPVHSMVELRAALRSHRPGESVTLVVVRGGQPRRTQATLTAEPGGH
jgi:S1-C subfamily serine protease